MGLLATRPVPGTATCRGAGTSNGLSRFVPSFEGHARTESVPIAGTVLTNAAQRSSVKLRTLLVAVAAVLALASAPRAHAAPNLMVGVDDDSAKWIAKPMILLPVYRDLGIKAVRVTIQWAPGKSSLSKTDRVMLDRVVMATWGIRLVIAVDGAPDTPPLDPQSRSDYANFVAAILRRYPTINDVVIWTEPNSATFWRPQAGAPAAYEALLATTWDLLHQVSARVNVIAASAPHQNPAAWFAGMGAAYRASGRTSPLFDTVGHNAYPETSGESPFTRHTGSSIDEGDYDRLIAALQSAFGGTGQPVPGERGVTIWYMEDGFQTRITTARSLYSGVETDRYAVSEDKQARLLADAVHLAYCQPYVGAFFNFELRDETALSGWQSGVVRADWSAKPSFYSLRSAIIDTIQHRVSCQ